MIRFVVLAAAIPLMTIGVACSSGSSSRDADGPAWQPDAAAIESGDASQGGGEAADAGPVTIQFVGNITTRRQVRGDFLQYWNQITPENEGKWGSVERTQGTLNWSALDTIYKFAQDNNIPFKQHTFVWGAQQPGWVDNDNGLAAVQNWITSFCQRYPDTPMIDVVNEPPPHTTPAYLEAIGGSGVSGWDWIVNAFKWARAACPNSILIFNDYDNIENPEATQHTIDIVNAVRAAGGPIDAVGCQAHYTWGQPTDMVKTLIDRIASETGLPVYITEFDIDIEDDQRQLEVMREQFTMFWQNPHIKGITLWGYVYGQTWMTNTGFLRDDGSVRPAMTWLMGFLGR